MDKSNVSNKFLAEILMICDQNYLGHVATTMVSLFENNRHIKKITIHLMLYNIQESVLDELRKICNRYGRQIYFYNIDVLNEEMTQKKMPSYKGSYLPLIKLHFFSVYEKMESDRLIYFDSDLVIDGKIDELLQFDFKGKNCAMVPDVTVNSSEKYKMKIGLKKGDIYYNAGMMVFNVSNWMKYDCTRKIQKFIEQQKISYPFFEQDVINIILQDDILILPSRYNFSASVFELKLKKAAKIYSWVNYTKADFARDLRQIVIYHGLPVNDSRPWMSNGCHPLKEKWSVYSDYHDIKEEQEWKPSKIQYILYLLKNNLPSCFYIPIHKMGLKYYYYQLCRTL